MVDAGLVAPLRTGTSIARGAASLLSRLASAQEALLPPDPVPAPRPEPQKLTGDRSSGTPRLDQSQVITLIYELLDAHLDTEELAAEFEHDPTWSAHVSYLAALQRYGREVLAHIGTGTGT